MIQIGSLSSVLLMSGCRVPIGKYNRNTIGWVWGISAGVQKIGRWGEGDTNGSYLVFVCYYRDLIFATGYCIEMRLQPWFSASYSKRFISSRSAWSLPSLRSPSPLFSWRSFERRSLRSVNSPTRTCDCQFWNWRSFCSQFLWILLLFVRILEHVSPHQQRQRSRCFNGSRWESSTGCRWETLCRTCHTHQRAHRFTNIWYWCSRAARWVFPLSVLHWNGNRYRPCNYVGKYPAKEI